MSNQTVACYLLAIFQRFALIASNLCLRRAVITLLDAQSGDMMQPEELRLHDLVAACETIAITWISPHGELEQILTAFMLAIMALPATVPFAVHQLRRIAEQIRQVCLQLNPMPWLQSML